MALPRKRPPRIALFIALQGMASRRPAPPRSTLPCAVLPRSALLRIIPCLAQHCPATLRPDRPRNAVPRTAAHYRTAPTLFIGLQCYTMPSRAELRIALDCLAIPRSASHCPAPQINAVEIFQCIALQRSALPSMAPPRSADPCLVFSVHRSAKRSSAALSSHRSAKHGLTEPRPACFSYLSPRGEFSSLALSMTQQALSLCLMRRAVYLRSSSQCVAGSRALFLPQK